MNLKSCKNYCFALGKLIADNSGKEYDIYLEEDDRFYIYIKQHIIKSKVDSVTEVRIDELVVTDPDKTFFEDKIFTLNTKMLVTNALDIMYAYDLKIKGVSMVDVDAFNRKYNDDEWSLSMCALKIPYNTKIVISEIK